MLTEEALLLRENNWRKTVVASRGQLSSRRGQTSHDSGQAEESPTATARSTSHKCEDRGQVGKNRESFHATKDEKVARSIDGQRPTIRAGTTRDKRISEFAQN